MARKVKFTGVDVDDQFKDRVCFTGSIHDYTLCGLTLDGDSSTAGDYNSTKDKVNCSDCISIVRHCRGIKNSEMVYIDPSIKI